MNLEERFAALGIKVPEIWLPNNTVDLQKYAVLACDQYAAQPEYWDRVSNFVGDAPSALNMILPEAFLLRGDRDYAKRAAAMECYLSDGTLENKGETMVFCRRKTPDGERRGLIVAFDMEQYDFNPDSKLLIRATEETVLSRVPPRVEIRKQSPLELPHVLVLIDDRENLLMRALDAETYNLPLLYDFDLMEGGGHITGYRVDSPELLGKVAGALEILRDQSGDGFLFAMGDGNHSFAAAKSYWEELKPTLSPAERETHPARYALAEIINLYDPAMPYEGMNRLLTNVDSDKALAEMGLDLSHLPDLQTLQPILDRWLESHPEAQLEYVHDARTCRELGKKPRSLAFTYETFDKEGLFDVVRKNGRFVRKSFAMGHPYEKRYYLEARKIR
ncbi:MAG TPA: DUF1015 domain-containing protein [Oscillospiraceae bacterium]|nr:DUF1015 domain-containing protein [Oscillospiraceae bacterium]HRW57405.1 DUF1015 domain-containing protein [Oscillospiraceae bacterium]